MTRYMENLVTQSNSSIPSFYTWGDWCSLQPRSIATPATGPPCSAANFILATDAMRDMATDPDDRERWRRRGEQGRHKWHTSYYDPSREAYGYSVEGRDFVVQTLTSLALAMHHTVPANLSDAVVRSLLNDVSERQFHGTFGSVGQKHVFNQLTSFGHHDAALRIATQTTYPSFGYWIRNGATTCWENWSGEADAEHPPQPTHNHIFLCGGIGEWMYRHVVGIRPSAPGYARVQIRPSIDASVGPARSHGIVGTPYGVVNVSWSRDTQTRSIVLNVTTPKPTSVEIPTNVFGDALEHMCVYASSINSHGDVWVDGSFRPRVVDGVINGTGVARNGDGTQRVLIEVTRGKFSFKASVCRHR